MKATRNIVKIYSDGSCSNRGSGGWACIVRTPNNLYEMFGGDLHTTSMRMELTAIIQGLRSLYIHQIVEVYTDCKDIVDVVTSGKLDAWKQSGWILSDNLIKSNSDMWEQLYLLLNQHDVTLVWVKSHSGDQLNARCDKLARQQMKLRRDDDR